MSALGVVVVVVAGRLVAAEFSTVVVVVVGSAVEVDEGTASADVTVESSDSVAEHPTVITAVRVNNKPAV